MRAVLYTLVIAGLLSGCQSFPNSGSASSSSDSQDAKELTLETRTWISKSCLLTSEKHGPKVEKKSFVGAIAAVLLPKAIEFVIDSITTDLKKIKKLESKSSVGFDLYKYDPLVHRYPVLNDSFGCITTITAKFEKDSIGSGLIESGLTRKPKKVVFEGSLSDVNASVKSRLEMFDILISSDYKQVFEVEITKSGDKSAFRLENRFFHTNELLGRKTSAEIIYSYELLGPGATPNGSKYFVASIDLGEITSPNIKRTNKEESVKTGWISSIGLSKGSIDAFYRNKFGEKPSASHYGPVELVVKNTQIKKPSEAAKFIATVLEASKDTIKDSIVERVLPEDKSAELQDAEIALQAAKIECEAAKFKKDLGAIQLASRRINKACGLVKKFDGPHCETIDINAITVEDAC